MNIAAIKTDINLRCNTTKDAKKIAFQASNMNDVLMLLNQALATEVICALRYRINHFIAEGMRAKNIASEFLAHSNEELAHADRIAGRIIQLGGEPDLHPDDLLELSHVEYSSANSLIDMIKENIISKRIAINSYHTLINHLGDKDPTTSHLVKEILTTEEAHTNELTELLEVLPASYLTMHSQG